MGFKVAVAGATGNVGREILTTLAERNFPVDEIVALHGGLMNTITRDEVNAWAARILPAKNCRVAAIVPKAFVGIFEAGR